MKRKKAFWNGFWKIANGVKENMPCLWIKQWQKLFYSLHTRNIASVVYIARKTGPVQTRNTTKTNTR